jgi:hypothetical protein
MDSKVEDEGEVEAEGEVEVEGGRIEGLFGWNHRPANSETSD